MKERVKYFLVGFVPMFIITGVITYAALRGVFLEVMIIGLSACLFMLLSYVIGEKVCKLREEAKLKREEKRKWARLTGGRF